MAGFFLFLLNSFKKHLTNLGGFTQTIFMTIPSELLHSMSRGPEG